MNEEINVIYKLHSKDLECCICYDVITTPIIQCLSGSNHFVCSTCLVKSNKHCPQCRSSKLFHNIQLERNVKSQMIQCEHQDCPRLLLKWAREEHEENCLYKMSKCLCCDEHISIRTMANHFKTECNAYWIDGGKSCSPAIKQLYSKSDKGYKVDVIDIKKSFVVICGQIVTVLIRTNTEWIVKVYSIKHNDDIDVAYWMPKTADNYDTRTTISLKPDNRLDKHSVTFPTIPMTAIGPPPIS